MPAVSQQQQKFFGAMLGNPAEAKAKGISPKVAKEFASTKRKGLPVKVAGKKRNRKRELLMSIERSKAK